MDNSFTFTLDFNGDYQIIGLSYVKGCFMIQTPVFYKKMIQSVLPDECRVVSFSDLNCIHPLYNIEGVLCYLLATVIYQVDGKDVKSKLYYFPETDFSSNIYGIETLTFKVANSLDSKPHYVIQTHINGVRL